MGKGRSISRGYHPNEADPGHSHLPAGRQVWVLNVMDVALVEQIGTKEDVRREIKWLVENGPKEGLLLGASSSITPRTNRENIKTLIEGLKYYREYGRSGC